MTKLDPAICRQIGAARRALGLSQSALALEMGCKQSALSMFERGDGTKLNDEVIGKLAKKFGISLEGAASGPAVAVAPRLAAARGYCPNCDCPTNHPYTVGVRTLYRPDREAADPAHGKYCALCGEVLEHVCPNCGAPLHDGGVCSFCGQSYIAVD